LQTASDFVAICSQVIGINLVLCIFSAICEHKTSLQPSACTVRGYRAWYKQCCASSVQFVNIKQVYNHQLAQ